MDTTNKPVAWMQPDTLECGHGGNVDWEDTGCIPLYRHPVKTLTDGEIKQIFQEQTGFFFDDNPANDLALMDFARAILRKAQE
jgi:hypothetical protein